jgi:hypothetical protein
LCLVGDFTLIFVVEQFVYCCSSEDYWLNQAAFQLSFNLSDQFAIFFLLYFFPISVTLPFRTKKVMKAKVKEIDSLSLSLKIDLLNLTSFLFSHTWLLCRKIFFFLSSPEASIHFVSAFKQKKHTHTPGFSLSLSLSLFHS